MVPQDAGALAARAAHAEGVAERGRRRPRRHPAARRRRDAPLLHERRGAGRQAGVPRAAPARVRALPEASRDRVVTGPAVPSVSEWVQGARPRTLGAAIAPVARRHCGRVGRRTRPLVACRGRARRGARAPGRRELRQRLLRRRARHRRQPCRSAAADRLGARAAVDGAQRRCARVRGRRRGRARAVARREPVAARDRRGRDRCRRALHGRAPPVRILRVRRARGARVLRLRRHRRLRVRAGRVDPGRGVVGRGRDGPARVRRSCSPTTSATCRPTASPGSARSRSGSVHPRRAASTPPASPARSSPSWPSVCCSHGRCSACSRSRSQSSPCGWS